MEKLDCISEESILDLTEGLIIVVPMLRMGFNQSRINWFLGDVKNFIDNAQETYTQMLKFAKTKPLNDMYYS